MIRYIIGDAMEDIKAGQSVAITESKSVYTLKSFTQEKKEDSELLFDILHPYEEE